MKFSKTISRECELPALISRKNAISERLEQINLQNPSGIRKRYLMNRLMKAERSVEATVGNIEEENGLPLEGISAQAQLSACSNISKMERICDSLEKLDGKKKLAAPLLSFMAGETKDGLEFFGKYALSAGKVWLAGFCACNVIAFPFNGISADTLLAAAAINTVLWLGNAGEYAEKVRFSIKPDGQE